MAQDEQKLDLDEIEEPDDLEVDDLDDLEDADVVDDPGLGPDDLGPGDAVVADDEAVVLVPATGEDEDDDDEEDDLDPDDVEAGLDVILKDRLVVAEADEDEEDEAPDADERVDGSAKVLVKRPGEFVCEACFLVKHPGQLADQERMLCRDCV